MNKPLNKLLLTLTLIMVLLATPAFANVKYNSVITVEFSMDNVELFEILDLERDLRSNFREAKVSVGFTEAPPVPAEESMIPEEDPDNGGPQDGLYFYDK